MREKKRLDMAPYGAVGRAPEPCVNEAGGHRVQGGADGQGGTKPPGGLLRTPPPFRPICAQGADDAPLKGDTRQRGGLGSTTERLDVRAGGSSPNRPLAGRTRVDALLTQRVRFPMRVE